MTNSKSTKRSLLTSSISLLLCFAMLLGTTFAWFTDSASTGVNKIQSGNLDIEVLYATPADVVNGEIPDANWKVVDENTPVFNPDALWEPGYTEVVYFKIENAGSLALKYIMSANIASETAGINKDGNEFNLSDYLSAYYMTGEDATILAARDKAQSVDGWASMIPDLAPATLAEAVSMETGKAKALSYEYELKSDETAYTTMVILMPTTVGNEANHKTGEQAPSIDLGINFIATQYTYEKDSYDNQYDEDAEYPPTAWDGTVDTSWFDPSKTEFTISNGAQLAGLAALGNQLGGKTITLDSDINLGGKNWTPIRIFDPEHPFTFDGGDHTISNLNITSGSDKGLFDHGTGTIKNLKLTDAQMKSGGRSAILAGRHYGDIINCHIKNSTVEDSYWAVGGIVGQLNSGNIKNCSVTNVNVKSNGGVGGIVGVLNETSGIRNIENCSVIGGTIENTGLYGSPYSGGGIVGMINISNSTVNIKGCSSTATLKGEYIYDICPPVDADITLNIN